MNQLCRHGMVGCSKKLWELSYLFFRPNEEAKFSYSLNPRDSDLIQNSTLLNSLVSTLVKYGPSGRIEPYLSKSFTVSSDNKKWIFKLHPNLKCEDGVAITSSRFAISLTNSLKRYSLSGDVLDFENLRGWSEFKNNIKKSIDGVYSIDKENLLIFEFEKSPSDLLELLRMPYFGFWCESNFNSNDNNWKNDHTIVSSGSYKVESSIVGTKLILRKRNDWLLNTDKSPDTISFSVIKPSEFSAVNNNNHQIVMYNKKDNIEYDHKAMMKVSGPPTMFFGFALSPYFNGLFKSKKNRQIFNDRVKKIKHYFPAFSSDFFYFNATSEISKRDFSDKRFEIDTPSKAITFAIASNNVSKSDLLHIEELLTMVFSKENITFKIIQNDAHDDNWFLKVDSNVNFDARITTVDIGGHVINAAIKMMFCSQLGVNFGDPSERICALVSKQTEKGGPIDQAYIAAFNEIIQDDSIVIPLYHYGLEWLVSTDIDLKSLPLVATEPIFEKIQKHE